MKNDMPDQRPSSSGDRPDRTPPTPRDPGAPVTAPIAPSTARHRARAVEDSADRLTTLAHELAGLLDGSMRSLNLVLRSREAHESDQAVQSDTDRRLKTVRTALEQMTSLISDSVGRSAWTRATVAGPQSLFMGEAVRYAVAILEPLAADAHITLSVEVAAEVERARCGPVYSIVTNGVRNSIEAIIDRARTGPGTPRRVEVVVAARPSQRAPGQTPGPNDVILTIKDTGIGPPPSTREGSGGPFEVGFSTKVRHGGGPGNGAGGAGSGGAGVGLALCREMVTEAGGQITLTPREDERGAVLCATFPLTIDPRDSATRAA